jgi:hypothetical protein
MNTRVIRAVLEEELAALAPNSINLWPVVAAKLANQQQQQVRRKEVGRGVAMFLFLILILFVASPQLRVAIGQGIQRYDILQRFGLVLTDSSQITSQGATVKEVEQDVRVLPALSLKEAQEQVPFPIPMPSILPNGLELWAVRVGSGPYAETIDADGKRVQIGSRVGVIITFKPNDNVKLDSAAVLSLTVWDGTNVQGGYAVPEQKDEEVVVNGKPAIFIKGAWRRVDLEDFKNMTWDHTADVGTLSWESNGFTYILEGYQIGLTRDNLIQIAESVR